MVGRFLFASLAVAACGRAAAPPPAAEPAPAEPAPVAPTSAPEAEAKAAPPAEPVATKEPPQAEAEEPPVPITCHDQDGLCVMPPDFAGRLCTGKYTDLAIYLFQKSQPWSRGYIRSKEVDVINTLGGPVSDTKLVFGEEVLIVGRKGGGHGKVQISGNTGYQVLRWDGTCATLADHEIVKYVPGVPRNAPIVWKFLANDLQAALLKDPQIESAREAQRQECHGVRFGTPSKKCEQALRKLNDAITMAVRSGMELPLPSRLPE